MKTPRIPKMKNNGQQATTIVTRKMVLAVMYPEEKIRKINFLTLGSTFR